MKFSISSLLIIVLLALVAHTTLAAADSSAPFQRLQVQPQFLRVYQNVTAAELLDIWQQQLPSVQIIDVREVEEYSSGHIPGAFNFPLSTLEHTFQNIPHDKDLYVHCKGGFRSLKAIAFLETKGYVRLFNVKDGFDAWTGPVERFDASLHEQIEKAFPSAGPLPSFRAMAVPN